MERRNYAVFIRAGLGASPKTVPCFPPLPGGTEKKSLFSPKPPQGSHGVVLQPGILRGWGFPSSPLHYQGAALEGSALP